MSYSIVLTDDPALALYKGIMFMSLYNGSASLGYPDELGIEILRNAKSCFDHYTALTSKKYEQYDELCQLINTIKLNAKLDEDTSDSSSNTPNQSLITIRIEI